MEERPLHILIREKRRKLGMSQAAFAKHADVDLSVVQMGEIGRYLGREVGTTKLACLVMGFRYSPFGLNDDYARRIKGAIEASRKLARKALVIPGSLPGRLEDRDIASRHLLHKDFASLMQAALPPVVKTLGPAKKPPTPAGFVKGVLEGWEFPTAYHEGWNALAGISESQFQAMRTVHRQALAAWMAAIGADSSESVPHDVSIPAVIPVSIEAELGPSALAVTAHHVLAVYAAGKEPTDLPIAFFTHGARTAADEVAARIAGTVRETVAVRLPDGRLCLLGSAIEPVTSADVADITAAISVASDERKTLLMSVLSVPTSS